MWRLGKKCNCSNMVMILKCTKICLLHVGVLYPDYHESLVMAHKSRYDRFQPVANGWGTMHPILDMAPPLLAEQEGPPT
jgi:hypothetical protein